MSDDDQARWEWLEEWLIDHEGESFTVSRQNDTAVYLPDSMRISTTTASLLIQGYLLAQRSPKSETLYLLKRTGRTKNAIWSFGKRVLDARALDLELYDDIIVKVNRAWRADVNRLGELNPKLVKRYERKVEALMGGALVVLRTVLDDGLNDEG